MEIITVKMLETCKGSPNGVIVREYDKGKNYDLPESLATALIDAKLAKKATAKDRKADE